MAIYNNEFILVVHVSAQKIIMRPQNHRKNDRLYVATATKKRHQCDSSAKNQVKC